MRIKTSETYEDMPEQKQKIIMWIRNLMPLFGFIAIVIIFSILTDVKIISPDNISLMLSQV